MAVFRWIPLTSLRGLVPSSAAGLSCRHFGVARPPCRPTPFPDTSPPSASGLWPVGGSLYLCFSVMDPRHLEKRPTVGTQKILIEQMECITKHLVSFEFTESLVREMKNSSGPAGFQITPFLHVLGRLLLLVEVHAHSLLF